MRLTGKSVGAFILRCLCAILTSIPALLALPEGTNAQDRTILQQQFGSGTKNSPLLLQADEMIYDRQNDRVIGKGNVEIYYDNYVLLCDQIVYDQKANTLTAEGNVRIKEPDGSTVNADKIALTDNFRDGFIRSLRVQTKDEARIAASNAYRKDGETTVYENGKFTPCKACESNPDAPPLWQVKAQRIIHKKSEQNIYFENATFDVFGLPVVWLPYFYVPDPTVKRRSGFLTPSYGHSEELGYMVEAPYYYALSPSADLTLTPSFTTEAGVLLKSEWRQRLQSGSYRIRAYGAYDEDPSEFVDDKFRGSIDTTGEFALGSFWKWGWDATLESDDTFRRFYKIDSIYDTDRVSQIYLIGQSERNYFSARAYHFGGLTLDDSSNADSVAHPIIDYNYIFGNPVFGGELSFNMNALALSRDDGADENRIIGETRWRRQFTDSAGQIITPFAYARADAYKVTSFTDPISGDIFDDDTIARGTVAGGIEYRYPFVKHTANASHVIEPIAQIIARPSTNDLKEVPNEDAQSLIFDDTLLFDIDKFSGYDRLETGTRANLGVQYSLQTNSGWGVRTVVGQSYHLAGTNPFPGDSGLEDQSSDFVTGVYIETPKYLRFVSQARFDDKDLEMKRQDLQVIASLGPFYASASYVNAKAQPELGFYDDREETSGLAAIRLTDYWTLFADARYDIALDQFIRDSVGVRYADECIAMTLTYAEQFVEDGEIKPDQTVMFRVELKGLGAGDTKTDAFGALSPEASLIK